MQNHVHDTTVSQVEKLGWGEHRTPAASVDSAFNAFIYGLHGQSQFSHVRKPVMYFLHVNSLIHQAFRQQNFTANGVGHPQMRLSVVFIPPAPAPLVAPLRMLRCPAARSSPHRFCAVIEIDGRPRQPACVYGPTTVPVLHHSTSSESRPRKLTVQQQKEPTKRRASN
jgi:hypothetical protein